MTVRELEEYFKFFPDPIQEVRFSLTPYGTPKEEEQTLELCGSTVPEAGPAVIVLRPLPVRKYMFSLKFEANPVIEAHTVEEAEAKAFEMMRGVGVTRQATSGIFEDMPEYEAQEPCFLEEVKE